MSFKDFSFDIQLAHTDGLAKLVERFQLDAYQGTRDRYMSEPHLCRHVREEVRGWIDTWPQWVCARLLTLCLGPDMTEKDAISKLTGPIQTKVRDLSARELPSVEFFSELRKGLEAGRSIWKICSKSAPWIAEVRMEIEAVAKSLGFAVMPLIEDRDRVHIPIRGKWRRSQELPPRPFGTDLLCLRFEKLGFRRRYEYGTGCSEPCGAIFSINFGVPSQMRCSAATTTEFLANVSSHVEFPSLSHMSIRTSMDRRNECSSSRPLVHLHESTSFPLESDLDVGIASSIYEAERAAIGAHAHNYSQIAESTEPLVLLTVKRNPREYHEKLATCGELKGCRDNLVAAGKSFMIEGGGYIFVRPEQYNTGLAALSLKCHGVPISAHHILLAQEYERDILSVIQSLKCNLKVLIKSREKVPTAAAAWLTSSGRRLEICRTFISPRKVTSSILSTVVASTTDAHGGRNPRRV